MGKPYDMKSLGIPALVGRKVRDAVINPEHDMVILRTNLGSLYLTWEGGCCSKCYLNHVNGTDALIGAEITAAENAAWTTLKSDEDGYRSVEESMGTKIKTTKGYVDFETRLEHNGYYSGKIMVSDDEPMDQYHSPRYGKDNPLRNVTLLPLEDF